MRRNACLLSWLLLASFAVSSWGDEPQAAAEKSTEAPKTGERRLDPERLKALRDRLKNVDPEKLKTLRNNLGGATLDYSKLERRTWKVGDVDREALVYLPPKSDGKSPVVFAFHGHSGRSEFAARKLAIHEHWPEAICVYPQGLPTPIPVLDPEGKQSGWQKFIGDQDDRDLKLFDAMLASLKAERAVDENRIYSTGHSNGGFFTYVLWAARDDVLAAVAPIAGGLNRRDFERQSPKPVLHVAGENDPIVAFALQQRTIEQVRKLNGCEGEGKPAGEHCTEYRAAGGMPVVAFIHPGKHEIPAGAPQRIARFFQEHTHEAKRTTK